jgi:hypothetical protein
MDEGSCQALLKNTRKARNLLREYERLSRKDVGLYSIDMNIINGEAFGSVVLPGIDACTFPQEPSFPGLDQNKLPRFQFLALRYPFEDGERRLIAVTKWIGFSTHQQSPSL